MKNKLVTGLRYLYIILLFSSMALQAQGGFLTGKGRYVAQDGEKLSFIKEQLLYEAAKDIITQQMHTMHYDAELFWQQYDLKFNDFFAEAKKELMEKENITSEEEAAQNIKFQKKLQHRKRYLLSRFGRLKKVLASYVIQRMSHSSKFNKVYHITILAKVNKNALSKKYAEFTQGNGGLVFKTLYIRADIKVQQLAWPEIGVEVVSDFKQVVLDYWAAWLTKSFQGIVEKVVIVNDDLEQQLLAHQHLHAPVQDDSPFKDSAILNAEFDITKLDKSEIFHNIRYSLAGRINVIDLNDQKVVTFADIPAVYFSAKTTSDYELSSNVATNLYKYPLPSFVKALGHIKKYNAHKKNLALVVMNVETVKDLFLLKKFLETMGIVQQLEVELGSLNVIKKQAVLNVWIGGSLEQFQQFFLELNNRTLRNNLSIHTSINNGQLQMDLLTLNQE